MRTISADTVNVPDIVALFETNADEMFEIENPDTLTLFTAAKFAQNCAPDKVYTYPDSEVIAPHILGICVYTYPDILDTFPDSEVIAPHILGICVYT